MHTDLYFASGVLFVFAGLSAYLYLAINPGNVKFKRKWLPYCPAILYAVTFVTVLLTCQGIIDTLACKALLLPLCIIFAFFGVYQLKHTKFCDSCGSPVVKGFLSKIEHCANRHCRKYATVNIRKASY